MHNRTQKREKSYKEKFMFPTKIGNNKQFHYPLSQLEEHPFDIVAGGQMKRNVEKHFLANIVLMWLKSSGSNQNVVKAVFAIDWVFRLPKRVIKKLKASFK